MLVKLSIVLVVVALAVAFLVDRSLTNTQFHTIAEVSRYTQDPGVLAFEGKIAVKGDNEYLLLDGTGKAQLLTCPIWYKRIYLRDGERVTITGEPLLHLPRNRSYNLVISVHKIRRDTGTITIRNGPGKPPWVLNYPR